LNPDGGTSHLKALALPIPILFESRRKKLRRFLRLDILTIDKIWLPCLKELLKQENKFVNNGMVYVAIHLAPEGIVGAWINDNLSLTTWLNKQPLDMPLDRWSSKQNT
jgi:hypothetical protein